jgi:hypothetical protein
MNACIWSLFQVELFLLQEYLWNQEQRMAFWSGAFIFLLFGQSHLSGGVGGREIQAMQEYQIAEDGIIYH